ncbi:DUF4148 domain-containing protein [Paraburkholderia strydomiana]|uniref:DUF4148 domain-containing protein n=1 Tax=Paraburkholderia strydomiana TaxID=1245417 RepID=UPI0038BC95C9
MKLYAATLALALASLSSTSFADADHRFPGGATTESSPTVSNVRPLAPSLTVAQDEPATGKTREQVVQELIQARRDGYIPAGNIDYPPSSATIARNRSRFEPAAPEWAKQ